MSSKTWAVVIIVVLVAVAGLLWEFRYSPFLAPLLSAPPGAQQQAVGKASYTCDEGKTIDATYYQSSVALVLSDGRTMTLPQTISGSGIRYANAGESIVFWSKGNTAFMQEQGTTTFANCVSADNTSSNTTQSYASTTMGISFSYPADYTLSDTYSYQEMGPGKDIPGVKVTIPDTLASGTNLSNDSYVSIEQLNVSPPAGGCTANKFLDLQNGGKVRSLTDNGTTYSVASSTGAGAGNRYEEWVWAIPGSSPCSAVRYFIHYGVIDNYPAGTVQPFDEQALLAGFDTIRRSLTFTQ